LASSHLHIWKNDGSPLLALGHLGATNTDPCCII